MSGVAREEIAVCGKAGQARQPQQPPDLESGSGAECLARIQVRAAGVAEATPNLGKAENNETRYEGADQKRSDAVGPDECKDF